MSMSTHGKSIVAFLYAVAVAALPLFTGDRNADPAELVAVAIAVTAAVATWLVPLAPSMPGIKTAVAAVLAGLQIAATLILDGTLATDDVLLIAATVLGALGIAVAPASSAPGTAAGTAVGWGSDTRTA
jgi:hypothetical protein